MILSSDGVLSNVQFASVSELRGEGKEAGEPEPAPGRGWGRQERELCKEQQGRARWVPREGLRAKWRPEQMHEESPTRRRPRSKGQRPAPRGEPLLSPFSLGQKEPNKAQINGILT